MANKERPHEGAWDVGWEGHERAQLLRIAAWPLPLKLRWLEEAQVLVQQLQRQRARPQDAQDNGAK